MKPAFDRNRLDRLLIRRASWFAATFVVLTSALALLAISLMAVPGTAQATPASPPAAAAPPVAAPEYVCPMAEHAQVFDHPGKCPLCGMDLVARAPADELPTLPPLPDTGPPYICPMDGHTQTYDHPGVCPICHMPLVSRRALRPHSVAVVVFDGVDILDWTGAYEVFGQAGFRVFTVAPEKRPVTTAMNLKLMPDYPLGAAPPADVVVVPGGAGHRLDRRIVDWLRQRADHTDAMLGVSNGAFWLARAGLLDGLEVTTTHGLLEALRSAAPKARVVGGRRAIDSGRVLTASGAAAGLDGALRIVDRTLGRQRALDVARQLAIDWQPETRPSTPNAPSSPQPR